MKKHSFWCCALLIGLLTGGIAQAHGRLYIAGSLTVFPFAAAVAERYARHYGKKIPLIEGIGTSGGIHLFCGGNSYPAPDIVMTSRPMTAAEKNICQRNGMGPLKKMDIGWGGLVFIHSAQGPAFNLTVEDILKAITQTKYTSWADIRSDLPKGPIQILGPAATSGNYDLLRHVLEKATSPPGQGLSFRQDEGYIAMSDNQNILIQKLLQNPHAVGIVTFSFFKQNKNLVQAIPINGISPSQESLTHSWYPFSGPLFLYLKRNNLSQDMLAYLKEFKDVKAIGPMGYLIQKGLIPSSNRTAFEKLEKLNHD